MNNPVARIMDANFNRAGEALRTVEEYARFVCESPAWSELAKQLRHDLSGLARQWAAGLPASDSLLANRDIAGDIGAGIKTEQEGKRGDAAAVASAACRRAAEALRVLSEYAKIDNQQVGAGFEKIRYRLYALEPLLFAAASPRDRLATARLYVLVTTSLCSAPAALAAREAVAGGADMIQLREKEMEDGEFYRLAAELAEICRAGKALLIINDRPHIAALVDAAGVHGGQGDLPIHLTRRILGPDKIVGRSTSAPEFAEKALSDGADYLGVGPVYETNTKQHRRAVGLEYVRWAAGWNKLPFFAIGSVNRDTINGVLDAGAKRVAICTAITKAKDIAAETEFFKQKLREKNG
ncbi:MAG: thiamine phosphate synthase [Planctomycetes bacterium]|nr:thiamine phosphate synthase [Planctomycetota bacterium]